MATSNRFAAGLTEDYLTCAICCETYDDPRKMTCDHTFCSRCITDYSQKFITAGILPCPICRQETVKPTEIDFHKWVSDLPLDSLLVAILKTITNFQTSSLQSSNGSVPPVITANGNRKYCIRHRQQEMDVFCFTHAQELCSECAWLEHKDCECSALEESAGRVETNILKLKEKLDRTYLRVNELERKGEKSIGMISENKEKSLASLQSMQNLLQEFWAKAQCDVQHVAQCIHGKERDINEILSTTKALKKELECLTEELGNASQKRGKIDKMTFLKGADSSASDFEKRLQHLTTQIATIPLFTFKQNDRLVEFCKDFENIGTFITSTSEQATDLETGTRGLKDSGSSRAISGPEDSVSMETFSLISHDEFFQSISHRTIHVGENIRGIYTLSDVCVVSHFILVLDQYSSLLMKYDALQGICREMIRIVEPHQMSVIPGTTILKVTSWSTEEIYTVETCPKLAIQGTPLRTANHYIGIHVLDKQRMLVTSLNRTIEIISFRGDVLHQIQPKAKIFANKPILLPAKALRLSDDSIIVFDSVKKSLVAMEISGKIRWLKNIPGLSGFAYANNTIYASIWKSNAIMTLTLEGKIKDERFLTKNIGIKRPWAIDVHGSVLVITEDSPSGRFHVINTCAEETSVKAVE